MFLDDEREKNSNLDSTNELKRSYLDLLTQQVDAPVYLDDDPDNTVSIMLDGIEARLHIITIDIDLVRRHSAVTLHCLPRLEPYERHRRCLRGCLLDHRPSIVSNRRAIDQERSRG